MRCTDMIKFVLFDLDDTLLDFHKAEAAAIKKTFSHIGIPTDDGTVARYSEINASQWRRLEKGEISREQVLLERFDILFDELGVRIPSEMAQKTYEYLLGVGHYFIDGAPEVLNALHGKYRLYIVSNGTANVQDRRLHSADMERYFDGVFISERVGHNKPSKAFFDACRAFLPDVAADECVMIGDSLTADITGGKNAGMKTIWYNHPHRPVPERCEADQIVDSLLKLKNLL